MTAILESPNTATVGGRTITGINDPASPRQTWAIRCASGLDVRGLNLTKLAAAVALDGLNSDDLSRRLETIDGLERLGATGKARREPARITKARPTRQTRPTKAARKAAEHAALYNRAKDAARAAAKAANPTPMIVQQHANVLDDSSEVIQTWDVPDGECGMAHVEVKPARGAFIKWALETGRAKHGTYGGAYFPDLDGGRESRQSYERHVAGAGAAARVLREAGLNTRVWSHVD